MLLFLLQGLLSESNQYGSNKLNYNYQKSRHYVNIESCRNNLPKISHQTKPSIINNIISIFRKQ